MLRDLQKNDLEDLAGENKLLSFVFWKRFC